MEILFELACVSRTEPESKVQPDVADCGIQAWAARPLQKEKRTERCDINYPQQHSAPSIPQRLPDKTHVTQGSMNSRWLWLVF